MKCPDCKVQMKEVQVKVEGADQKVKSYQCPSCDHVDFEPETSKKVIAELKAKETPLKIKQKIVKLSQGRVGIYFNRHVVESLNLKPGNQIAISVPDKKHIVLSIDNN
ncbi:zf-TFIIB domain-containing protein [Candidatus Woesearchaeota archaeon]|nr:zf-TFIIB domain-containing protein [Candidatus Woesearchaeota archaeon]